MYDPTIGRFNRIDRFADKYYPLSPYSFTANNPIIYVDIKGDSLLRYLDNLRVSGGITYNTLAFKTSILGIRTGIDISPDEQYLIGYQGGFEVMGTNRYGENVRRASLSGHIMGLGASKEVVFKNEKKGEDINSIIFLDNYSGNSGSESHKSIGFGFKAGFFLGIKLNIEYHLKNSENQVIPELNYNVPGILDSMEGKNVKKINFEFGNISEQEKDKIVQFMKGYENRNK
jgi:hypothetical protein